MPNLTPLATDELAEQIAEDYLHSRCQHAIVDRLANHIVFDFQEALRRKESDEDTEQGEQDKEERVRLHSELFEALFKAIEPYERKFADFLRGIWEQERKIIIANLKKMKKAWLQKQNVDNILYPKNSFVKKITDGTKTQFEMIMESEGSRLIDVHEFDVSFDVTNPEVQKWLKEYTVGFGKALEGVNHEKLRRQLIEGMSKGEGIPELMKRVNTTYANWSKFRSENIARTESLLASNKAAVETFRMSGVVKSKVWVTFFDRRTCPSCETLDGTTISLEENFFNLGDPDEIIKRDGKTYTFKNDYRNIGEPPRHAMCRCTVAASFEEVSSTYAKRLTSRATKYEPRITRNMKAIANNIGASLNKLQFRLKSLESIKRKLASILKENPNLSTKQAASAIKDTVRYTAVIPEKKFASAVSKMHAQLESKGFELEKVTNYYGSKGAYQGINAKYIDPKSGLTFELQFHAKQSVQIIEKNHLIYEKARISADPTEITKLNNQMIKNWDAFKIPEGATSLFGKGP